MNATILAKLTRMGTKIFIMPRGVSFRACKEYSEADLLRLFPNGDAVSYWYIKLADDDPSLTFVREATAEEWGTP